MHLGVIFSMYQSNLGKEHRPHSAPEFIFAVPCETPLRFSMTFFSSVSGAKGIKQLALVLLYGNKPRDLEQCWL